MEAQGCGRNANADGGHAKQTTRIQGKEGDSGITQNTLTTLKPLQLTLEMNAKFPKKSWRKLNGYVTTKQVTITLGPYMKYLLTRSRAQ